jgi:hypothetical protein
LSYANDIPQVRDWSDIPRAIAISEGAGAIGQAHLLRALYTGRIAFLPMPADTSTTKFKDWARATTGRPAVALLGDDDGCDAGPSAWRTAERAVKWARSILIHGAAAEIAHHESAIIAAELIHRVLIVECGTATLGAWVQLVRDAPHRPTALIIQPRGGVHPVPLDRGGMH